MILAIQTYRSPVRGTKFSNYFSGPAVYAALDEAGLFFGPRKLLELDPGFKQVIPYLILKVGDKFVRYTRSKAGSESRLHDRKSIGIGGHIEVEDILTDYAMLPTPYLIMAAARRELEEEIGNCFVVEHQTKGFVIEEETPVGKVHLGVVIVLYLSELDLSNTDVSIADPELVGISEIEAGIDHLEQWSQLIVPHLSSF